MGGGAIYHDNRVEVELVPAAEDVERSERSMILD